MSMLSLVARLGLDTTGFTSGLRDAEGATRSFSSRAEGSIATLSRRLLTGAFFLKLGKDAIKAARDIDEVSAAAERLGITLDEGLIARANEFNNVWDSFVVKAKAAGIEAASAIIDTIQGAVNGAKILWAGLFDVFTLDRYDMGSRVMNELNSAEGSSAPTAAYSELFAKSSSRSRDRERNKVKEKGFSTMEDYMDAMSTGRKGGGERAQPLDSLASIGGFTRGVDIAQATTQERIAKAAERTAYNTESLKGGGF